MTRRGASRPPPEDMAVALVRLLRIAARSLDAPAAYVDFSPDGAARRYAVYGGPEPDERIQGLHRRVKAMRSVQATARDGRVLAAPLVAPGSVLGALSVQAAARRTWTDEDVATLQDVAALVTSCLERTDWPEQRIGAISEQMSFLLWTTDRDGFVNYAVGDGTGPLGVLVAEAARHRQPVIGLEAATARAVGGVAATAEHRVGSQQYAIRLDPLRGDDGAIVGALATGFDMTPWAVAQEGRRDAVRLETVGQLAGGVAHELNNVLAMIAGHATLMETLEDSPAARARTMLDILDSTRRGSEITQNLLGFAMRGVHRPIRIDVNQLVRDVVTALAGAVHEGVNIDLHLDDVPDVLGDRAQLTRALTNLCLNALDAMPQGGNLTLETCEEYRRAGTAGRVRLRVVDEGVGMTKDQAERAFEPFFTASPGSHVGLGLSMVYGVVKQHDGVVRLDSLPDDGTTVTIELPALDPPVSPIHVPALRDVSRRPTVLVVDDERMLRRVSSALIGLLGYECVEAADGASAIERFAELHERCAFVLLDVVMPGMSGVDALREMLAIDPDARIVLATGHPRDFIAPDVFALGAVEYLGKPYTRAKLHAMIRQITGHDELADATRR